MTPLGTGGDWPVVGRGGRRATDNGRQESLAARTCGDVPSGELAWQLEWRALRRTQTNALIVASALAADQLVDHAKTFLLAPIHECNCAEGLSLPADAKTVILRYVDALAPEDQSELLRWLALRASVQLLSVCEKPLFPMVERAEFLEPLFYQLNVITIVHPSVFS
jgi:transcriptional regulator of aromatic amino acid metabolism